MRNLQQTRLERLPPSLLRTGHLRVLYVVAHFRLLISPPNFRSGQASLPETCPVCAHTPISSDLCKPNKALRTTLKAFLRTEEKKREKERQSTTPIVNGVHPVDEATPSQEIPPVSETPEVKTTEETVGATPAADVSQEPPVETNLPETTAEHAPEPEQQLPSEAQPEVRFLTNLYACVGVLTDLSQIEHDGSVPAETVEGIDGAEQPAEQPNENDETGVAQSTEQDESQTPAMGAMPPNGMGMTPGMFPNMGWNGNGDFNPMSQFMGNGMFNFPNPMGTSSFSFRIALIQY